MKYSFSVYQVENEGEFAWVAESKELKNCLGVGDTQEEAISELAENEEAWLETAQANGYAIPEVHVEAVRAYSGKLTLRLSPKEHEKAAKEAEKQGISLNQLINDAIVSYTSAQSAGRVLSEQISRIQSLMNLGQTMQVSRFTMPVTMKAHFKPYTEEPEALQYTTIGGYAHVPN